MRICPRCNERFDDASRFCPLDGEPLPVDEADARIGTTLLGQFELLEVCGKGAMGTVYRAWQTGMERHVAIKILRPELLRDPKTVARFDREARAVAKLQHPNIVTFFLVGHTDDGLPFLAMEYVEGQSLGAVAEHERILPVPRALHIARQITSALTEAHAEGIVHRDLKPANILLTDRRRMPDFVKVLDFGIAKILGPEVDAREALESRLTRAGAVFGTPHYIAPEQAQGGDVDHRVDLYSLGVILYRLLTGQLPFDGSGMNVLLAHIGQPVVPPSEILDGFDPRLEALIMRALEKDPANRFQSAEDMADALDAVGAVRTTGVRSDVGLEQTEVAASAPDSTPVVDEDEPPPPDDDDEAPAADSPRQTWANGYVSTPPTVDRPARGRKIAASLAGFVLLAGAAAGAGWLLTRDAPLIAATRGAGTVSPPPASIYPSGPTTPPPATTTTTNEAVRPPGDYRTVTLGEEGYAIRAQVPRDPRIATEYSFVFDVLDRDGRPLAAPKLAMTVEDPEDHDEDTAAPSSAAGHYELTRAFEKAGRYHVHVFPDGSSKKLHIWFDVLVKDAEGKLPEPKVAPRPAKPRPATTTASSAPPPPVVLPPPTPPITPTATPVTPEPTPAPLPPVVEEKPPAPSPPVVEVHEGAGNSDPYHDGVIEDDQLKDPPPPSQVEPPSIREPPPRIRWRVPSRRRVKSNPDGLE